MTPQDAEKLKRDVVILGDAVLRLVADSYGLRVQSDASEAMKKNLTQFMPGPYHLIFESRQAQAPRDFMRGVEIVSGSACNFAATPGRNYVSGSDINEAVKINFCKVWPFCK